MEFSPFMIAVLVLAFLFFSYFMGMLVHSALMYEEKGNIRRDSLMAWALCMMAGLGITGWLFYYGYYANFVHK